MGPWEETIERVAQSFPVGEIMTPNDALTTAKSREEAPFVSDSNPDFSVIPIRPCRRLTGYFLRGDRSTHDITLADVISDGTTVLCLLDILGHREFSFVLRHNRIEGYVHFSDLNHPLVKLTFYVLLGALEREAEGHVRPLVQRDTSLVEKALGEKRLQQLKKKYRQHGDAARNIFNYMNISDVLRVAVEAGTIQASDDFIRLARRARNAAVHPALALVTRHNEVSQLADLNRETLRLLGTMQTSFAPTAENLRSMASSVGR